MTVDLLTVLSISSAVPQAKKTRVFGIATTQTQQNFQHIKIITNIPIEFSIVCFKQ